MAIIKEYSLNEFIEEFKTAGLDDFSSCAYEKMFDDINAFSEDTGENFYMDVKALCSVWKEDSSEEILSRDIFDIGTEDEIARMSEDEKAEKILAALEEKTTAFLLPNNHFLYIAY